ncbi:tyrosyl-DNA phosphodiesterase 1 KNAG_0M00770 [Huiozyma naganishii CBS 8797]|uniref:Uncharacterized protein n=1 Tax=Huiozyma naganishii (strain ATCC MYA-139 / BCRC 22969 / CBS 8797 / KCTC 17520 / NBRC 10181 / NCYC 3082 / Yp74L-3) TaxID=1071383 RepID=J7RDH5_HUIN7|nr:hypothetical protein KNAG_0M00770 [Kazachstania naganishii CBS 8797]CCK72930.1 hypothetical protein KNAG_0M00770 [Kazachstania naganishii CBS 8797]
MQASPKHKCSAREAVARRWRDRDYSKPGREVIVIDSESESDNESAAETDVEQPVVDGWCFKLLRSSIYDARDSAHLIGTGDILGDPNLESTVLFSFQFELDSLFASIHGGVRSVTLVAQVGTIQPITERRLVPLMNKTRVVEIKMPPYSCHHSKLIINRYKNGTWQLFMPSNNFTTAEENLPQQVCWISPVLHQRDTRNANQNSFQTGLLVYLDAYRDRHLTSNVKMPLEMVDFAPLAGLEFISSVPSYKDKRPTGLRSLVEKLASHNALTSESLLEEEHILCQTSSMMNSTSKANPGNILTHTMIPLFTGITPYPADTKGTVPRHSTEELLQIYKRRHITPYLIFPTVDEIRSAPTGEMCAGWFNFNWARDLAHYAALRDTFRVFYKQDPNKVRGTPRATTPAHSKFYMSSPTNDFSNLNWCCYTSSNLGVNAWGTLTRQPRNYEVGILIPGPVKCRSFIDTVYGNTVRNCDTTNEVTVPFTLPPVPYTPGDDCYNRA